MARIWGILLTAFIVAQLIYIFANFSSNDVCINSPNILYPTNPSNSLNDTSSDEKISEIQNNVRHEVQAVKNNSNFTLSRLESDESQGMSRVDKVYHTVQTRWKTSPGQSNGIKHILYWNPMYSQFRHFLFGDGDVFEGCKVPHCYATPERTFFYSLEKFDAILFNGIEVNLWDLPHKRSPHQRYIFVSLESTKSRPIYRSTFVVDSNFYNWTMTYRLDSDVIRPSRQITEIKTDKMVAPPVAPNKVVHWRQPENNKSILTPELMSIMKEKQGMAAWFVSNCYAQSKRDDLANNLQKYFKVDIYGQCGSLKCGTPHNKECYDMLEKKYFFYFSFENTLCEDYVTEKLFEPLSRYVIPVVYGGANYSLFAPPHSYINVNDFKTIKELAEYLIKLSQDPEEYASYFWWKKYYRMEDSIKSTLCRLCESLHDPTLPPKSIGNFYEYYAKKRCFPPKLPEAP